MIKFNCKKDVIKCKGYVLVAFKNIFQMKVCRANYDYINDLVIDELIDVETGEQINVNDIVGIEYIETKRCYEENDEQLVTISITCPNCKTYMNFNRNAYVTGNPSQYFHVCPKCHTQALVKISTEFKKDERSI